MSDLNSWEDDPAAQDENLARQAQQQLNMGGNNQQGAGGFRAGAASFQPAAQVFQPGQSFSGNFAPQYQQQQQQQQQQYYGGQGYYPQYGGGRQNFGQYGQQGQQGQQGYGNVYGQGGYNQGHGASLAAWSRDSSADTHAE